MLNCQKTWQEGNAGCMWQHRQQCIAVRAMIEACMFCDDGRHIASAHGVFAMAEGYPLCMCDCGTHRGLGMGDFRDQKDAGR